MKQALEASYEAKSNALRAAAVLQSLEKEHLDVTLPGRPFLRGRLHPTTQTMRRIYGVFAEMGFQIYLSREVETDEYNFQLLNFPPHHPAREMQDTLFVDSGTERGDNPVLLRTHTSPGQIHAMREFSAANPDDPQPVRIILPGMCYRYEQVTTRHEMQFNQIEGLAVGEHITFGDLKGTLSDFVRRMFGQQVRYRDGYRMFRLWRGRLFGMQTDGLVGDPGLWNGASHRSSERRLRSWSLHWLCVWHGPRAHHHAAVPYR